MILHGKCMGTAWQRVKPNKPEKLIQVNEKTVSDTARAEYLLREILWLEDHARTDKGFQRLETLARELASLKRA